jgi:hypothetical protein
MIYQIKHSITVLLLAVVLLIPAAQAQNSQGALVTGNITGVNTAGGSNCPQCVLVNTTNFNLAGVTVHGTFTGVTLNFEFSDDGVTWYPNTCARTDIAVQESSESIADGVNRAWDCSVYNTTQFRVRPTTYGSGTAIVGITLTSVQVEAAPTVSLASGPTVSNPVVISSQSPVVSVQQINKLRQSCNALRTTNCN